MKFLCGTVHVKVQMLLQKEMISQDKVFIYVHVFPLTRMLLMKGYPTLVFMKFK